MVAAAAGDVHLLFLELGAVVSGLALLARLASRFGFSSVPLFLLAGLAFGNGGFLPLNLSEQFVGIGGEIGVLLLLFMLGLEYTGDELRENLRSGLAGGAVDFLLNFPPGLAAGLLLGWPPLAAVLLGGVTYISSSGVIAKVLGELRRRDFPETPGIISILVLEDLVMALYLPLVAVLLLGRGFAAASVSVLVAVLTVSVVLFVAVRQGGIISRLLSHHSDEIVLLTTFGFALSVAGAAQLFQVSAAIGAFLAGIALSGHLAVQAHRLLSPLRDLFAATFFFFFGLQIDPSSLLPVLAPAAALAAVSSLTKLVTGRFVARRAGLEGAAAVRAGVTLIARGEFSIVIAGLGVTASIEPDLGPLAAAYVLLLAIAGPLLVRWTPAEPAHPVAVPASSD